MRKFFKEKYKNSKTINLIVIILAVVVFIFVLVSNNLQLSSTRNLQDAYEKQQKYQDMALSLQDTSDFLTNQVRLFAVTGNIDYFYQYWDEAKNQMNRERIIDEIEKSDLTRSEQHYLERAKYFSDTLMHIEISSMKIKLMESEPLIKGYSRDEKEFIEEQIAYVKAYELEEDYINEQTENPDICIQMLYGTSYIAYKNLIDGNVSNFKTTMTKRMEGYVAEAVEEADKAYTAQVLCSIGEIVVLIVILTIFQHWYINPIIKYKQMIARQDGRRGMFVVPEGVWELQEFAEEFNALSSEMIKQLNKYEKVEKKLMEANEVKSNFLTQMSHELRTPLNTINGYLYLLKDTRLSGQQHHYVENMQLATEMLLEEINEILDYSKLQSSKMVFEEINFSLKAITENIRAIFENEAEKKGLDFQLCVDDRVPDILQGDPLRLKQILTNLIYNALKFTHEGSIKLSLEWESSTDSRCLIRFSVQDTGIGVAPDRKNEIFKAFSQGDSSITRKYGGTGLGLPICRKMVEAMSQGRYTILLESQENVGSCFYFDMDFAFGKSEPVKEIGPEIKNKRRDLRILIVDDNRINLVLEAEILHKFGYIADIESDPAKVLKKIEENNYQIVFLDISMPDISGYDLAQMIREKDEYSQLILIALTANIGSDVVEKVLAAGMNDYLPKPIPIDQLRNKLEYYTGQVQIYEDSHSEKVSAKVGAISSQIIDIDTLASQLYGDKEAVKELFTIFIEDNTSSINTMEDMLKRQDWDNLETEIHRIKGVSGNLLCRQLEMAVTAALKDVKDHKIIPEHMKQMYDELTQVLKYMEKYEV